MINSSPVGSMYHFETCFVFHLFIEYWRSNHQEVWWYLSRKLSEIWIKNNWCLNELFKICIKIEQRCDILNPNLFFGKELFYIEHVKSCVLLDLL